MGPISGTIIMTKNLWMERSQAPKENLLLIGMTFTNTDVNSLERIMLFLLFF